MIYTQSKHAHGRTLEPFLRQVSAKVRFCMIYSFGRFVDVWFSGLVWGDTEKVKSLVKSRLFAKALMADIPFSQLLVFSGCFLSGMSANICSFVHRLSSFLSVFIQGGFAEKTCRSSAWIEIHAAINVPVRSQTGSKTCSDVLLYVQYFLHAHVQQCHCFHPTQYVGKQDVDLQGPEHSNGYYRSVNCFLSDLFCFKSLHIRELLIYLIDYVSSAEVFISDVRFISRDVLCVAFSCLPTETLYRSSCTSSHLAFFSIRPPLQPFHVLHYLL